MLMKLNQGQYPEHQRRTSNRHDEVTANDADLYQTPLAAKQQRRQVDDIEQAGHCKTAADAYRQRYKEKQQAGAVEGKERNECLAANGEQRRKDIKYERVAAEKQPQTARPADVRECGQGQTDGQIDYQHSAKRFAVEARRTQKEYDKRQQ